MLKAFRFPSQTHDHTVYVAVIDTETRETWCVCPGFYHGGACRHTQILIEREQRKAKKHAKKG
jgi:hypothetical protein